MDLIYIQAQGDVALIAYGYSWKIIYETRKKNVLYILTFLN